MLEWRDVKDESLRRQRLEEGNTIVYVVWMKEIHIGGLQ